MGRLPERKTAALRQSRLDLKSKCHKLRLVCLEPQETASGTKRLRVLTAVRRRLPRRALTPVLMILAGCINLWRAWWTHGLTPDIHLR